MNTRVTLSPGGQRELELALVGGLGASGYRSSGDGARLPAPAGAVAGEAIELLDEEGTPLAQLTVTSIDEVGEARWLVGDLAQLRPFGHLPHASIRVTTDGGQAARCVLVLGDLPDLDDPRWDDLDGRDLVLLDVGHHPERLSQDVARATGCGVRVHVLPAPDASLRSRDEWVAAVRAAAEVLCAHDVEMWDTDRSVGEGVVILLTGLSGSGKSTIAKLLAERLSSTDARVVSLLDGDEVRLVLSSGLGFSREDRIMNVRRIGWVAALIAKHGGIAVCAPIAPYESMRAEMRNRVEQVGRFVLVHISTPLEVCEQRDRKGLYAKARAGEIPQFTGISDPYEEPTDANVVIDASVVSPADAVEQIIATLG